MKSQQLGIIATKLDMNACMTCLSLSSWYDIGTDFVIFMFVCVQEQRAMLTCDRADILTTCSDHVYATLGEEVRQ